MINRANIRWIALSVLLHAAALLGAGLASAPLPGSVPQGFSVTLLPSLPGEPPAARGPAEASGTALASAPEKTGPVRVQKSAPFHEAAARDGSPMELQPEPGESPADVPEEREKAEAPEPGAGQDSLAALSKVPEDALPGIPESEESTRRVSQGLSTGPAQTENVLSSSLRGPVEGGSGAGYVPPEILSLPEPPYPVFSRRKGEEGRVVIEVKVGAGGRVLGADVVESSSHERLDRAALEAAGKAAFNPAKRSGSPVESRITVAYRFRLEGK